MIFGVMFDTRQYVHHEYGSTICMIYLRYVRFYFYFGFVVAALVSSVICLFFVVFLIDLFLVRKNRFDEPGRQPSQRGAIIALYSHLEQSFLLFFFLLFFGRVWGGGGDIYLAGLARNTSLICLRGTKFTTVEAALCQTVHYRIEGP